MKFLIPKTSRTTHYISDSIKIDGCDDYYRIVATKNIKSGETIIIEYPEINLFGEENIDRGIQSIIKYIEQKEDKLYPRNNNFIRTRMITNIHKIIKNTDRRTQLFFNNYSKSEIEMYYAKYIFNAFEGYNYGPLTLPTVAKLNHSCNPNAIFNFDKNTGCMVVKAIHNIKKGSEICASYLLNKEISNHKEYLYEHYGFTCDCE